MLKYAFWSFKIPSWDEGRSINSGNLGNLEGYPKVKERIERVWNLEPQSIIIR